MKIDKTPFYLKQLCYSDLDHKIFTAFSPLKYVTY